VLRVLPDRLVTDPDLSCSLAHRHHERQIGDRRLLLHA
jgi:hypothetical protein